MNKKKERARGGNRQTRKNRTFNSKFSIAEITADIHWDFCNQRSTRTDHGHPGHSVAISKGGGPH